MRTISRAGQYAHAAAILVLTPHGRIARYFYGVTYPARDFVSGLVEASEGKIGTADRPCAVVLLPVRSDDRKYGLIVMNVVRAAGLLTLLVLGIFMFVMFRRERNHPNGPPAVGVNVR